MKIIQPAALKRTPRALVTSLLLTLAFSAASCKRTGVNGNKGAGDSSGQTTAADVTSTTPPFATKEPERYQATVVTSGGLGPQANVQGMSALTTTEMLVARDGEKRRMDVELFRGMKVSYLQLPSGVYILLPAKKIYAEFKPGGETLLPKNSPSDFSPDKLLNQSAGSARYEELGKETINGRAATKYRITTTGQTGEAKTGTTESLIWIDDSLGIPVKSETTASGGPYNGATYSMEWRDIKQEVDPSVFELPTDYQKVDYKEISRQLTDATLDSTLNKE